MSTTPASAAGQASSRATPPTISAWPGSTSSATVRLTHAALPGMIARGRGAVINVASVAAFSPFSGAMYSGTKAFLAMFSAEPPGRARGQGRSSVQALCPGMTHTEFHEVAAIDKAIVPKPFWMTAEKVVRISSCEELGTRRSILRPRGWKRSKTDRLPDALPEPPQRPDVRAARARGDDGRPRRRAGGKDVTTTPRSRCR
ncbi:MAG: SDR family NAD(P)-dependent oxidoreductase [Anaerotruncus sp.]|nr:SDR family NAD(P)-dependent oxidoreductase [Anaerotruncus sp.]